MPRLGGSMVRRLAVGATVALLLLAAVASSVAAAQITVPKPQGYVTDLAGVIDGPTKARLTNLIRELKAKTGAEIAVVTVRTTQPESAFDYAMALAEQWKPGSAGKDDGIVFLVAVDDREMQILTGYGVEGPLPDGKVGEIRDTLVVPAFKSGDYARGIADATTTMAALIAADKGVKLSGAPPPTRRPARRGGGIGLGLILLLFVISAFLNTLGGGRGRRRSGWGPIILGGGLGGLGRGSGGFGGGGFGGSSGGFGGFGGGGFGGGGAGGKW